MDEQLKMADDVRAIRRMLVAILALDMDRRATTIEDIEVLVGAELAADICREASRLDEYERRQNLQ